jgi:non-canonical (house-cleaning) NTP pyrophosphatase
MARNSEATWAPPRFSGELGIRNRRRARHYGRPGASNCRKLAREVLENGVELSVAIDKFAGAVGIRDAQGAWGVLSNNFITRQEAFRVAVLAAFAPFYNEKMYRAAAAASNSF